MHTTYSEVKIDGLSFFVASSSNSRGQHTVAPYASPKTLEKYTFLAKNLALLSARGGFMSEPQMAQCQSMHTVGFNSANLTTDPSMSRFLSSPCVCLPRSLFWDGKKSFGMRHL